MNVIVIVVSMHARHAAILFLFFLSGTSSLMFETLWQRMMILVFGASAPATAAVLTAFFLGLAFGSWIGGRLLVRFPNALVFYAIVEAWIGVSSLAVPSLIELNDTLLHAFGDSQSMGWSASTLRFALAISSVLPAALGMGATVPVMSRLISEMGRRGIGGSAALAYGLNTLGAILGCLLVAFVMIARFGVQNSIYVALALNVAVVIGSLLLCGRAKPAVSSDTEQLPAEPKTRRPMLLLTLYGVSGFLALAYEIVWMRVLAIYTATSTATFAIALSTYLLGFVAGSLLLYPLVARRKCGQRIFAIANIATGATALATIAIAYTFPALRWSLAFPDGAPIPVTPMRMVSIEFLFAASLMLVPTLFMGTTFPAVCQALIDRRDAIGRRAGFVYFVGSLGSAIGVVVAGLVLVPTLGLVGSLGVLCMGSVVVGMIAIGSIAPARQRGFAMTVGIAVIVGAIAYIWVGPPHIRDGQLSYGEDGWEYSPVAPPWHHASLVSHSTIARYRSGASATVIVKHERLAHRSGSFTGLYVDDHHVASTRQHSLVDAKFLAHLPLMLHPSPRNALTVGFGSGGTSWSMTRHGIETFAVEIEPEVPRSAAFFESQNHRVLNESNFRLILNDARNHLRVTGRRYDVISTDVTNLQYRQNGSLYSLEYFQLMKDRLTDDGIACAWIPLNAMDDAEFKVLLRTFQAVFPNASLWHPDHVFTNFAILIGTPRETRFDLARLAQLDADPALRKDLADIGIGSFAELPLCMYLDPNGYRAFVGDGPLHTDDRPYLEFSSPVSYYNFSLTDDLLGRLNGILAYRPASYVPFLEHATDAERERIESADHWRRLWSHALRVYHLDHKPDESAGEIRARRVAALSEVLRERPDFAPARQLLEEEIGVPGRESP